MRLDDGCELPPDELEKIEGARRGRSLAVPREPATRWSCALELGERPDDGRRLVSLRFCPWPCVASAPGPAANVFGGDALRSAKADAEEANETWLAFQRERSPPRIESTGETGRVLVVAKLVDGVMASASLVGPFAPRATRRRGLRASSSPEKSLRSAPVVSPSSSSPSVVVPEYSRQLKATDSVGERVEASEPRRKNEGGTSGAGANCRLVRRARPADVDDVDAEAPLECEARCC